MPTIAIDPRNMLGMGMMRLPVLNNDQSDVNVTEVQKMADLCLQNGFNYFDTSYVYHNGHSESAAREAIVEFHPRDAFVIATKFPTFILKSEDEIEGYFQQQLENLGVSYINFYLLHNLSTMDMGTPDAPGIGETTHLFNHAVKWREEGRIQHLGFSFHDTHEVLDRLLTEHPEVEFVQIVVNYYDWTSPWIQSRKCLDVIRKHGKLAIAMEPVKGGYLADVPQECLDLMHGLDPDLSPAGWALRFAASQDGVFKVLSGMSNLSQVQENVASMRDFRPLTDKETEMLLQCARILRESGPMQTADFAKYKGLTYHGMPVDVILEEYNCLAVQPLPSFAADNNYAASFYVKEGIDDPKTHEWGSEKVELDGEDITPIVENAWKTIIANMF